MKRLFAAVLAVACVAGSTSGFARGGMGHGAGQCRNPRSGERKREFDTADSGSRNLSRRS